MVVKTKFDVDKNAWYMLESTITSTKVIEIRLKIKMNQNYLEEVEEYVILENIKEAKNAKELFTTEEDLLVNLIQNKKAKEE